MGGRTCGHGQRARTSHPRALMRANERRSAKGLATVALRATNTQRPRPPIPPAAHGARRVAPAMLPNERQCAKKLPKVLVVSKKMPTFAPMKEPQYVITGVSRLTGYREEISRPMEEEEAKQRLERELASRKHHKHPAYTRLRVERRLPVQLSINWNEND